MKPEPRFVRMADAEAVFGVTDDTLRKWSKEGGFKIHKIGGVALLKITEVEAYIVSSEEKMGG